MNAVNPPVSFLKAPQAVLDVDAFGAALRRTLTIIGRCAQVPSEWATRCLSFFPVVAGAHQVSVRVESRADFIVENFAGAWVCGSGD